MNSKAIVHAMAALLLGPHTMMASESLVIENVTVISPEQPRPVGNRHVLILDGRIAAVSGQAVAAPAGTRRLDGTGKFLTPGIMDAHVHVSQAIGLPFESNDPAGRAAGSQRSSTASRCALHGARVYRGRASLTCADAAASPCP